MFRNNEQSPCNPHNSSWATEKDPFQLQQTLLYGGVVGCAQHCGTPQHKRKKSKETRKPNDVRRRKNKLGSVREAATCATTSTYEFYPP
jgi:hypothetical protein